MEASTTLMVAGPAFMTLALEGCGWSRGTDNGVGWGAFGAYQGEDLDAGWALRP
jgi:hypothetical protein